MWCGVEWYSVVGRVVCGTFGAVEFGMSGVG